MPNSVGIITYVTNSNGVGPGHTALWVDGTCYSFEQMAKGNGWLVLGVDSYVNRAINLGRPLVYYKLNGLVSPNSVEEYLLDDSAGLWPVYGPNVCSQRASLALNAGTFGGFNPYGYDTPFGVYWCAWRRNIVSEWWAVWKKPSLQSASAQQRIYAKLESEYGIGAGDLFLG